MNMQSRWNLLLVSSMVLLASVLAQSVEAQATAPYLRTIIVSPVPGDSVASGAALRAAVASVNPNAASPWTIQLEPGIYNLGSQPLQMKKRLNLFGSGKDVTTIQGSGQSVLDRFNGVLKGADKMELRDFRLECVSTTAAPWCIAMANVETAPRISDVHFVARQAHSGNWGIRNSGASPEIEDCDFTITSALVNYGIANARNPVDSPNPFIPSHPTIRRTTILAKGGSSSNDGILNKDLSSPVLVEDTEITAFGGTVAAAMRSIEDSESDGVVLRRVIFLAHSATQNYGVGGGDYGTLTVEDSRIEALGPTSYGIETDLGGALVTEIDIRNSEIRGQTTIVGGPVIDIRLSTLAGTGSIDGYTEQCAAVVDDNGTFYATTCP